MWVMGWFSLMSCGFKNPRQYFCSGVVLAGNTGARACCTLCLDDDMAMNCCNATSIKRSFRWQAIFQASFARAPVHVTLAQRWASRVWIALLWSRSDNGRRSQMRWKTWAWSDVVFKPRIDRNCRGANELQKYSRDRILNKLHYFN